MRCISAEHPVIELPGPGPAELEDSSIIEVIQRRMTPAPEEG